ncbi:MAG: 3-phosphoshikimate 1-carboxyvinyltransferase [Treponema sp.]|nr:3-phosphoshikimate 1-carboxyvinyltransferase [Candidatus Treponema scatequi]
MTIKSFKSENFGKSKSIRVPGSKSHTIRALILASLCDGETKIYNPLKSEDALATAAAIKQIGAEVKFFDDENYWLVKGAGDNLHLPEKEIDVKNSGSLMYFLTPVLATLEGRCVITGDESIQKRPVDHLIDALCQLGADAFCQKENSTTPPFEFTGPISNEPVLFTEGKLSQYISGFMMAATRMNGLTQIMLTNPQETPYLSMTKYWLDKYGVQSVISPDYKCICISGPCRLDAQDVVIPSDWEAVAFPLLAAICANEKIIVTDIDDSGTQGDEKIVDILKDYGADIEWNKEKRIIEVNKNCKLKVSGEKKIISMRDYPDAICALAVIASIAEGITVFTDIDICRKKETDRIKAMTELLSSLGADIKDNGDTLEVNGRGLSSLHGGKIDSFKDHRIAMSFACLGLAFEKDNAIEIKDAECCAVSFPEFYEIMNSELGASFLAD